jgi:EpsG family
MGFYYLCFLALLLAQFGTRETVVVRLCSIGVALFLIAGLRSETVDHDYLGYLEYYSEVLDRDFVNVEPTFMLLAHLVRATSDNTLVLFIAYAALGLALKVAGIFRLSPYPLASMLVYYSGFFLLWEMTQIRAAVAGGLLLMCVSHIRHRRLLPFLALSALAVTFHYASLIFLPLYLINPMRVRAWVYYALVPTASLLYTMQINLVQFAALAPIQLIELKIRSYETYADLTVDNVFNAVFLARCALAFLLFANRDFLSRQSEYFLTLIKIYFAGLFLHVALSSMPGFASRLSELLLVVEVILIPMLIPFFKERVVGHLVVAAAGLTFLTFTLHYTQLMRPYALSALIFQ